MEGLKINLFGSYGLLAVLLLASAWVYPHSSTTGSFGFGAGIIFSIVQVISDIAYKHHELEIKASAGYYG